MKKLLTLLSLLLVVCTLATGCSLDGLDSIGDALKDAFEGADINATEPQQNQNAVSVDEVPEFSGAPFVTINDNQPTFTEEELVTVSYEFYSPLDSLGRCGYTMACIGRDIMPTEKREEIGSVKPTGWQSVKYDIVDGKYLYNRCHLIGFQLTGENANKENLITGTRYMNVDGMLPFENMVADYIKETGNHVIYRVTPIFEGNNLVANGVQMEAFSVEDEGDGICFNVYVYNNQPGVTIDYKTGHSHLSTSSPTSTDKEEGNQSADANKEMTYILNTNTKRFHSPDCSSAKATSEQNKTEYVGTRAGILAQGYTPCGVCKP